MGLIVCLVGAAGALIAILLIVILCLMGKKAYVPLGLFALCVVAMLVSGQLPGNSATLPASQEPGEIKGTAALPDVQPPEPKPVDDPVQNDPVPTAPETTPAPPDDLVDDPRPVQDDGEYSGTLGDYSVEIKDAVVSSDYSGDPAIIITYSWTNNSEDTTSAEVQLMEKAFQGGVQLDTAYIGNTDIFDSGLSFKELRPGTTLDVQCAFLLLDDTSVVEFELTELFSFSDDVVTKDFDPTQLK